MLTTISILICKTITKVCHLFKRDGSVFPGSIVYKIDKKALWKIKYPKYVIAVTGSSGKGSTVSMLAHILKESGLNVVWNNNGSNINNAIMTLILNHTKAFSHEVDADVVLLEMDERYINGTFKAGTITHMAITNITRDQPARNIHPDIIFNCIKDSTDKDMHLILNADDPIVNRLSFMHKGKVSTYGVDKTEYSSASVPSYAIDAAYCPKCHTKLKYSAYHYGHLGIYTCPKCDFKRGKPDFTATDVDLKSTTFKVNGQEFKLNKSVFFAVYYTLAAISMAKLVGVKEEEIIRAVNVDMLPSKRGKSFTLDKRKIEMLESKNENALSYLQSLNYIKDQPGKKTVIMGFENVSRRYSYNDLSWLWDVDFELLQDNSIDKIFCIGRFKYDVATRLDYANIPKEKIVLVEDLTKLLDEIVSLSKGDIYTMVCFDMTEVIRNMLKERENEEN